MRPSPCSSCASEPGHGFLSSVRTAGPHTSAWPRADIKLTKDGNVLLREMQIQNPTAIMIAKSAIAQDDVTGCAATLLAVRIAVTLIACAHAGVCASADWLLWWQGWHHVHRLLHRGADEAG